MYQVGILTDSTAQFPTPFYPGNELVSALPMQIRLNRQVYTEGKDITLNNLPLSVADGMHLIVQSPSVETFRRALNQLEHKYQDIIVLLLSKKLNPAITYAHQAAASIHSATNIHIIDSQTTTAGLGLLVQAAARDALMGVPYLEIKQMLRGLITRIYTIFCIQSLTYLPKSGHLDPAQAIVGEMLDMTPIFILENGQIRPTRKVHSSRNIVDNFHEFITEIDNLQHIVLLKGIPAFVSEAHSLRERIRGDFSNTQYSELNLGTSLGALLGPQTLGLVAMEKSPDV